MFSYINGEITEKECDKVVVDVGGVGFELFCSDVTLSQCAVGECRRLYVYLQVKEDGMCLYGFSTLQEKAMFMRLISVSGVGCKMAAAVLSGMEAGALAQAIFNGDAKQLTKIKGLGKKTAERIILELREKVAEEAQQTPVTVAGMTKDMADAVAILCSLGKNASEAEKLVEAASKLGAVTAQELINMAFRIN
ncbi:MAG TPA: Holliday junction branch migration protein RuvA [Candidatus Fimimonas merdipullorum]|uniref:Holliday junction branch migration complex subunit RuvA n=1 Tax=Candidatus Fimimonas merdipullorum TaxID=2840822 RepID=A0A9D1SPH9_9BACT|nr:Holliday junction branch migration protein RuvA [Candidatus Fimimonas merdipullorum]